MANPKKQFNDYGQLKCSSCNTWKNPSDFNKNKQQKTGYHYACRACSVKSTRKYNLVSKYGITAEEYGKKLLEQEGKCACCRVTFEVEGPKELRPHVDHNHTTGEVRDLLCSRCNLAAGNVGDSSKQALNIYKYLIKWNC